MARRVNGSVRFGSVLANGRSKAIGLSLAVASTMAVPACGEPPPASAADTGATAGSDTTDGRVGRAPTAVPGAARRGGDVDPGGESPGADDVPIAAPSDGQQIVDGFALSLLKLNDGTFKIYWVSQGVATYEVWTSDDPYFEPGDVGSVLVESDADLFFYATLDGEAYYRVRAPGAAQPLSTVVGQLEYPLVQGYSKLGICLVSSVDTWPELAADMKTWPNQGFLWDPTAQTWITGSTLNGLVFGVGEVVIARHVNPPIHPTYSAIGYVPTEPDVTVDLVPGSNFVTTLPLRFGPVWASELLATIPGATRVGSPHPTDTSVKWYPDEPDWLFPTCSPVVLDVTEGSPWPPASGGDDAGGGSSSTSSGGSSTTTGAATATTGGSDPTVTATNDATATAGATTTDTGAETTTTTNAGETTTGATSSGTSTSGGATSSGGDDGGGDGGGDDGGGPPDPADLAPPLDPTVTTGFFEAVSFLFEGDPAVQVGVAPGTISPERVAVVRGTVSDRGVGPIAGATVSVIDHPELGSTLTREDGRFDLAVNGGGPLRLAFTAVDRLPVQRTVRPAWQADVEVPPVVLVAVDPEVSIIDFALPIEVHTASPVSDGDGSRTNVLMFREGTVATMVMPDESTSVLPSISVRATEYTIGDEGPAAMPGTLPPASAYTYAVEYTIDEAEQAGAARVELSPPAIAYLENFVGFPVGGPVPLGAFDPTSGAWIAEPNGSVVEIVGQTGGLADLDLTGDGVAESGAALVAAGIDDAEREALVGSFTVGTELWRMPVPHMSPWDANWPFQPPDGAGPPPSDPPDDPSPPDDPCEVMGSIIECDGQVLGEEVPVAGTPFTLAYRSDRVPGRRASFEITVPVVPGGGFGPVEYASVHIGIAGRYFEGEIDFFSNELVHHFEWDGLDAYGRRPQGPMPLDVCVVYDYGAVYSGVFGAFDQFGYNGNGAVISGSRSSSVISFTTCHNKRPVGGGLSIDSATLTRVASSWGDRFALGVFDARRGAPALGGWTLSAHHTLAPEAAVAFLGDGSRMSSAHATSPVVITRIAGNLTGAAAPNDGNEGPAIDAPVLSPLYGAYAPDGTLYFTAGNRIRRVDRQGIIHHVAGDALSGFLGDGGPAATARLNAPRGLAVAADGSVYFADSQNRRVRRIDPDGVITTVAGNGSLGFGGDLGPATAASLQGPMDVEVADDGTLYILQNAGSSGGRIRRVTPDGVIHRFAGGGACGTGGVPADGVQARDACLFNGNDMALGPDGSVYTLFRSSGTNIDRILRIGVDGSIRRIAGASSQGAGSDEDEIPALDAWIDQAEGIDVSPTGLVFFSDQPGRRVRYITGDGLVRTLAGTGELGPAMDGAPALFADVAAPRGVVLGPDGGLVVLEQTGNRIRRISAATEGYGTEERLLPSKDGSEVWVFDRQGRHLRTHDAATSALRYSFGYDADGRLVTITDAYDAVTEIVRNAQGDALSIVGPDGHETQLVVGVDGYLAGVVTPVGQIHEFDYDAGGLLTEYISPNGELHTFAYDDRGRLVLDSGAEGGSVALERTVFGYYDNFEHVEVTTALGRSRSVEEEREQGGRRIRTVTHTDGTQTVQTQNVDGTEVILRPDDTEIRRTSFPDPRFGMLSPTTRREVETPSGLISVTQTSREVTFDDPDDLMSLATLEETVTRNGRSYVRSLDVSTGVAELRTPAGREYEAGLDEFGRVDYFAAPGVDPVVFEYDDRGRIAGASVGVEPDVRTWSFTYDTEGNLIASTDPAGRVFEATHDPIGRVLESIAPDDATTELTYDASGNVESVTPPGRPAHGFAYDGDDRNIAYVPPDLGAGTETTEYVYDADDALVQVLRPNGQVIDLEYDAAGRFEQMLAPEGTTSVAYDATTGRVTSVVGPNGASLAYTYDGPLTTSIVATRAGGDPLGVLLWEYDTDHRRTAMTVAGVEYEYAYDADGLPTAVGDVEITRVPATGFPSSVAVGDVETSYGFDSRGWLASMSTSAGATATLSLVYERDALDRIVSVTQTEGAVVRETEYEYDTGGRLATVTVDGVEVAEYGYDGNGNRTSVTTTSGTTTAVFDAHDRLVEYGAVELDYAVTGELLTRTEGVAVTQYEHDSAGRLVAVELPDGTLVEYDLDARGRRVGKRVDGALERGWLYDGQLDPVAETAANGAVFSRFVYGAWPHVPDLIERDGVQYRVVTDHLGSVRQVIDVATGAVAQRLEYGPWGEVVVDTNPGFQPFGFAGGLYDADTGLVQFGAREYDAGLGRWISRDPVLFDGGVNLFAYAANDPVNLIDVDGRNPIGAAAAACAANPACQAVVVDGTWLFFGMLCAHFGLCSGDGIPLPELPYDPGPEEPVCPSPWSGPHIPLEPLPPPFDKPVEPANDTDPDREHNCFEAATRRRDRCFEVATSESDLLECQRQNNYDLKRCLAGLPPKYGSW